MPHTLKGECRNTGRTFFKKGHIPLNKGKGDFWGKVEKTKNCWNWQGTIYSHGYGIFKFNGRRVGAHRFAYEQLKGKIPQNLTLDHLCRNKICVNPAHLEPVTNAENTRRGNAKITQENVKEIINHYYEGNITQKELGEKFGIGQWEISRIINKMRWSTL